MNVKRLIGIIMGVLAIEGGILIGISVISSGNRVYGETEQSGNQSGAAEDKKAKKKVSRTGEKEAQNIYKNNKKILVLVNVAHELPERYDASLRTICNGRLKASERLYPALVDMLEAAGEEGHHYWIASAWRSREKQQKLVDEDVRAAMQKGASYQEALKETYRETMPAGHSEHETGLALDILCQGNLQMDRSQEKEPGNIWLRENSWRYGFILRYPEKKKKVTGIRYEPWHFRYVGKKAAAYMHTHNLTLEEFWERL